MKQDVNGVIHAFHDLRGNIGPGRFHGIYRGVVKETNDPLRMHRLRVLVPEMHGANLKPEELYWAVPAPWLGGPRTGSWSSPSIGDEVWITFERGFPNAPVWIGCADPTLRKQYVLHSVYGPTPKPVDQSGEPAGDAPDDYDEDYLPKDHRPYSMGFRTPYGQELVFNYTGYHSRTHEQEPAESGISPVAKGDQDASKEEPTENDPDVKVVSLTSGYGTVVLLNDIGHKWKEEFKRGGSGTSDEEHDEYLVQRHKYHIKQITENEPKERDQRRFEVRTRAGHKFEMRDVGWNKSRSGEYGDPVELSSGDTDERWIKLRTKGGHVFQMIDIGFDPEEDQYYKRLNRSEFGFETEEEDEKLDGDDKRIIRLQTRYGIQMVWDDRGSDPREAHTQEEPRGIGWYVRGRRNKYGHMFGFNERDDANHSYIATPAGKVLELNDRFNYVMLTTNMTEPLHQEREQAPSVDLNGVQHPRNQSIGLDAEGNTYHMKLDGEHGYARMKTPSGQGVEFRDKNDKGCKQWAEVRDADDRGTWYNTEGQYAIWRGKDGDPYITLDDGKSLIIIKSEKGRIQIHAKASVEIKAQNIVLHADQRISMKAGQEICMEAGGAQASLDGAGLGTSRHFQCASMAGTHVAIRIPKHPDGPAPAAPKSCSPHSVTPEVTEPKRPDPDDQDRGCAPNKKQAGKIPSPDGEL